MSGPSTPTQERYHLRWASAGPSTPPQRDDSHYRNEGYFDGVPGAPDRKLRSQRGVKDTPRVIEQRQARVKSVAKLLDFGGSNQQKVHSDTARDSNSSKLSSDLHDRDAERPRLGSPICLQSEKQAHLPASPVAPRLKRSLSLYASPDELISGQSARRCKKSRLIEDQTETMRQNLLCTAMTIQHHDTSMRRAVSASFKFDWLFNMKESGQSSMTTTTQQANLSLYDPFSLALPVHTMSEALMS